MIIWNIKGLVKLSKYQSMKFTADAHRYYIGMSQCFVIDELWKNISQIFGSDRHHFHGNLSKKIQAWIQKIRFHTIFPFLESMAAKTPATPLEFSSNFLNEEKILALFLFSSFH
jgi:hypothetical protein